MGPRGSRLPFQELEEGLREREALPLAEAFRPGVQAGIYGEEGESNTSAQCRAVSKDWSGSSVWFVGIIREGGDAHKPD